MNCKKVQENLTSYIKKEAEPEEATAIEEHLCTCSECRDELRSIKGTMELLRQELVPLELSAEFRKNMAEKLEKKALTESKRFCRKFSSRSHFSRSSIFKRFTEGMRKSPFMAASMALHVLGVALIVFILLKVNNKAVTDVNIESPVMEQGGYSSSSPWVVRSNAPQIKINARRTVQGLRLNVAQFISSGTLVIAADPILPCMSAYFAESADGVKEKTLLKNHPGALTVWVNNANVDIPYEMSDIYFANDLQARVFHFDDRMEFWSENTWQEFRQKSSSFEKGGSRTPQSVSLSTTTAWAVLPGRRKRFL